MMRTKRLQHRFVETMPEMIEPGILYVSMEYATAAHRCCCGCGEEVETPFSPAQWQMTFKRGRRFAASFHRKLESSVPLALLRQGGARR